MADKKVLPGTDIEIFSLRFIKWTFLMFSFSIMIILITAWMQIENWLAALFRRKKPAVKRKDGDFDVVCFSHVNWFHVWQRNHHTMMQFAKDRKVLYFCEQRNNHLAETWASFYYIFRVMQLIERQDNIFAASPVLLWGESRIPFLFGINRWICSVFTNRAIRKCGLDPDHILLWFYFPWRQYVVGTIGEKVVTYDIQDEYPAFEWAPGFTEDFEQKLLGKSDLVFTGTNSLYEQRKQYHDNIHFVQCGVDNDHFAKAIDSDTEIPDDIAWIPRPILGYFGIVEWRLDRELMAYAAEKHPDWSLVLIGPVNKAVPFPKVKNLYFLGGKNYKYLPNYTKAFDICMMPFAINDLTRSINPTKLLEYLAAGKPVISTAIPDVIKYYTGLVEISHTKEEFVELSEKLLLEKGEERIKAGIERARESSWDTMAKFMVDKMKETMIRKHGQGKVPV